MVIQNPRQARLIAATAAAFLCGALAVSCARPVPPACDGQRAFDLLTRQVGFGPRNTGSAGWRTFQSFLAVYLDSLRVSYEKQPFEYYDYLNGDTVAMVNWIARINPDRGKRVLICAHYDSRPRAERDADSLRARQPLPGANDGASGTAVALHLIELMSVSPPSIGVDVVLFDGEDYGPSGRLDQYLLGSAYFASHNRTAYAFGILIDMVGDRDLHIYREGYSEQHARQVNDLIWRAAAAAGEKAFIDSVGAEVVDDHMSLLAAGIRTVDIIDFTYPYWHTQADTPDKCSPASLQSVGRVILDVVYDQ